MRGLLRQASDLLWTPASVLGGVVELLSAAVLGPLVSVALIAGPIALMRLAVDHVWLEAVLVLALVPGVCVVVMEIDWHFGDVSLVAEGLMPLTEFFMPLPVLSALFWLEVVAELGQAGAFGAWMITWTTGWWLWALAGVPVVILGYVVIEGVLQCGVRVAVRYARRRNAQANAG